MQNVILGLGVQLFEDINIYIYKISIFFTNFNL